MNNCEWKYYAVTHYNKLVLGFEDNQDVKDYCKKHHFKVFTRNGLKNKKINPNNLNSWVDDNKVPEYAFN